jgi:predicted transcriptional regulator
MAMTLRLSDENARRLRERAQADGTSMQDVATIAIETYLDGRGRADVVDAALSDTLARYATTLRRLGE